MHRTSKDVRLNLAGLLICTLNDSPPLSELVLSGFCLQVDPELGYDILDSLADSQITTLAHLDLSRNDGWWKDKDCEELREKFKGK